MRNLFQGGNCNPATLQANSNQFKAMMQNMMLGNQNPEKLMEFMNQGASMQDQIRNRQMMFQQMNQAWHTQQQKQRMQNAMMEQYMQQQKIQYQKQIQLMQQTEWNQAQQYYLKQEQAMLRQFQAVKINHEAENWKNQLLMQNKFEEAKISTEEEQARIKNATSSMLDIMMNDPQPRFQNSEFIRFLKKINTGQLIIQGQQLIQTPLSKAQTMNNAFTKSQKLVQQKKQNQQKIMSQTFNKAQQQVKAQQLNMQNSFKKAEQTVLKSQQDIQKMYQQQWQKQLKAYEDQYKTSIQFQNSLEQKYMNVLKQMDLDLSQAWLDAAEQSNEQKIHGDFRDKYTWSQNNPFLNIQQPLNLALQFIGKGRNNQAIFALEAHLIKNQTDSESWRVLGRILQENDQDQKSVPCFINALKQDPTNLDSLLYLGISCTNILDQVKAMNFLKHWLLNNPKYSMIKPNINIIPDQLVNQQSNFQLQQIKQMNSRLIQSFQNGLKIHPADPQLLTSLAVLYFIKRQYQVAVQLFGQALKSDPTNYSLWNKLGAALAHLGKPDEAIECYHRALEIKPIYVRVWVNLGIAHGYKGMHEQAARFYLNALSFRPDAKHIWSYLQTTFMSMQRYDLIKLIGRQDPSIFTQFDVMKIEDLPTPQIDYMTTTQQHIIGKQAQNWTKEFLS